MRLFRRKAIQDRFEVKHAAFLYGIGAARWLERRFDVLATEGYEQNPVVYACVSKLAKAVSSVDIHLYRKSGGRLTKVEEHDVLDLLSRPNPLSGGRKLVETLATNYLVGGNTYLLGTGIDPKARRSAAPSELWVLPTQAVTVKPGRTLLFPDAFEYREQTGGMTRYPVDAVSGRSAVLHLKTVNPLNPLLGLPPLVAAAYGVDVFNSGQAWNKALLDNSARPPGALMVKGESGQSASLSDEQYNRLKTSFEQEYSGSRNAGRPLLLEGGLEWKQFGLSPVDMDHKENMLTNARFIAGVYGVPPMLVNIPGESTYSNFSEAKLAFWSDTVLPLLGTLLEDLGNWLTPLYGDDLFLWYDEEMIPALEPLRKEKSTRINASEFMTVNEKRRAMGLDDYEGGDVLLVASSDVPLELAGAMPALPEPDSEEDTKPEEAEE